MQDPFTALDATAELRRYSLVSPAEPGTVSVDRLVQAVTLDQLPDGYRRAWREAAGALVEAALPDEPRYREHWPAFVALLPHASAALDLTAPGTTKVTEYLGASGDHVNGRIVRQDVYRDALDRLGPEHPETLRTRLWFAKWTGHAGDEAGARDEFAALVPVLTAVLGPRTR